LDAHIPRFGSHFSQAPQLTQLSAQQVLPGGQLSTHWPLLQI
jgi:hypothetical protein